MSSKPDYTKLIDDQTWAFIHKTGEFYPEDAVESTVPEQRRVYNAMCRAFHMGYPSSVSVEDKTVSSIAIRVYTNQTVAPKAMILYVHGGGYVVGGLESHDDVCAELCDQTGLTVIAVDYRLAPEFKHPAAFDDCLSIYNWCTKNFDLPIILAGDSAGGNLCSGISHATKTTNIKPLGQVLIYPVLGGDHTKGSYILHKDAPMLTTKDMAFYEQVRIATPPQNDDATFAPFWAKNFKGLPPTVIITAECDPLSDDGETYSAALRTAGVPVVWINELGLVHGYLRARHTVDRARKSFERINSAIKLITSEAKLNQVALDSLG